MQKRIEWIDIARGLAIILMIVGHTSIPSIINNWIYSFHMPFFFFISGVLTSPHTNTELPQTSSYITHKAKVLIYPFLTYSAINILLYPLYGELPLNEYFKQIIVNGWGGIALWFVPVFFFSVIISYLFNTSKENAIISSAIFATIGIALCHYNINLPWSLSTVPIACMYILLGSALQATVYRITKSKCTYKVLILITLLVIGFTLSQYGRLDLASNSILPFITILIASLCGTAVLIITSTFIEKTLFKSTLAYIGKHTYEIMAFSQAIILIVNSNLATNSIIKYLIMVVAMYLICKAKDKIS